MYEFNGKRYIRVTEIGETALRTIKVPYRYRRVMCPVEGRPIQALVRGDHVEIEMIKKWETWVLTSLKFSEVMNKE